MFKSKSGHFYTEALFYEKWIDLPSERRQNREPVFCFMSGRPNLICFKDTFVELGDPTGYDWAMKYLGSWDHWNRLVRVEWFREQFESAVSELYQKMKATALRRVQEIALSANEGQALAAAKYLAERGWDKNTRGRPSKEEVSGEMKKLTKDISQTDEDFNRLGLTVVNGGKNG